MNRLERMQKAVAFLKGNQTISKQQDIVDKMEVHKSSVSLALKGNEKYLTDSFIIKFSQTFNLNSDWLLTGKGSMITHGMLKEDSPIYEPHYNYDLEKEVSHLKQLNAELKSNNDNLRKMISMLEEKIQDLQDQNTNFQENH